MASIYHLKQTEVFGIFIHFTGILHSECYGRNLFFYAIPAFELHAVVHHETTFVLLLEVVKLGR